MRLQALFLIITLSAAVFLLQNVSSQDISVMKRPPGSSKEQTVSIRAKDRGAPRVSYSDGVDLTSPGEPNDAGASSSVLTSADFDSDGIPDVITADISGTLRLYRGNADTIYPNSVEANARRAAGTFTDAAFYPAVTLKYVSTSPDYLAAGDFNADGHADILAARKGDSALHLLAGDGAGNLADDRQIQINGSITALTTGEIGRHDGQTDVAVALVGKDGASLAVFEHPEGAFKHKPEIISLPAQTDDLAIGHLDTDYFGDIAAASGNRLTIVRGRGHAYPWDSIEGYDIQRPAPIVETRALPSGIAALTAGYFTEKRGQSLAILTTDGAIQTLESPPSENKSAALNRNHLKVEDVSLPAKASSKKLSKFGTFSETARSTDESASPENLFKIENGSLVPVEPAATSEKKLSAEQKAALISGSTNINPESRERAKAGFLRAISPRAAAPLAHWNLQTIASDARLTSSANSLSQSKLVKVRASDSGRDELAFLDASSKQIHLLSRENLKRSRAATATEIASFDVESAPTAILPMRLNADALSDLVVLREGSASPSVVITSPANTFVVNTNSDEDDGSCGGTCSLREAINAANDSPGTDLITFSTGTATIQPESSLPQIDFAVTIDASTGPGNPPEIEIKGNLAGEGANGLSINAADTVVRGLVINEFKTLEGEEGNTGGSGIAIYNFSGETHAGFCIIENNYLGTDRSGSLDKGNEQAGLFIFDSDDNTVGGPNREARNLISGNGNGHIPNGRFGYGIRIIDGRFTTVQGNYVGVAADGSTRLANSSGIFMSGANNEIGGHAPGTGNTVSGNTHSAPSNFDPQGCFGGGIGEESIINVDTGEWVTQNSTYAGNRLGVNAAGNAAVSNCRTGFFTSPRNTATVGSITPAGRNTVSGNTDGGLYCSTRSRGAGIGFSPSSEQIDGDIPEGYCSITGNNVGTDVTGNFAIPNNHSHGDQIFAFNGALVVVNTDTFSTVGGPPGTSSTSCTGHCNLVSGNGEEMGGILRFGSEGDVGIWNNYVGTNKNGTAAVPNGGGIGSDGNVSIGGFFTESGSDYSLGNLISGNQGGGLGVRLGSSAVAQIRGNLIGTDVSGLTAIPNNSRPNANTGDAVFIGGSGVVIIGGAHPLARNIISGNNGTGIVIDSQVLTPATVNNYIGVNKNGDPLGNTQDGVNLQGSFEYFGDNGVGNIIANNGRNGIFVQGANGVGNRLRFNSIYNNGALGIDLTADTTGRIEPDGVTPNDCLDADTGPNDLQNYPILTTPIFNESGTVTVGGAFGSKASQTYTLDFYSNSSVDPTNYGEGETYIGSKTVTTDSSGKTAFQFTSDAPVASNLKITATATDSNGSTSEFSCAAGQCDVQGLGLSEKDSAMRAAAEGCDIGFVVNINTDQPDPNPADGICDVDLNTTGEQCSLRAAIQTTNALAGTDIIAFDIPGGGIQTILVTSDLPTITQPTAINATTQPGYAGTPLVEVNGSGTSINSNGLVFAAGSDDSFLSGITINRFGDSGVLIQANDVEITKSYIGVLADGINVDMVGKQRRGVTITGARNTIGGPRENPETGGNTIVAGNSIEEIRITGTAAVDNIVVGTAVGFTLSDEPRVTIHESDGIRIDAGASGNRIGDGEILLRNIIQGFFGIKIEDSNGNFIINNGIANSATAIAVLNSKDNIIGGAVRTPDGYNDRNLIVNNGFGIFIGDRPEIGDRREEDPGRLQRFASGDCDDEGVNKVLRATRRLGNSGPAQTTGNRVIGNLIGIRVGNEPLTEFKNCSGIVIDKASGNFVGSDEPNFHNFISGNEENGVIITVDGSDNVVQRNYIGTTRNGLEPYPNYSGVAVSGKNNQVVNNVISGNAFHGVQIDRAVDSDPLPTGNLVANNTIGLGVGNVIVPNIKGVYIDGFQNTVRDNTISGNTHSGIDIANNDNTILNNLIGTDTTGRSERPNGEFGILVSSSGNTISKNLISGNHSGITISRVPETPNGEASNNIVQGNYIGTNSAGTEALSGQIAGIAIANGANNNLIGGTTPSERNLISGNTLAGIEIQPGVISGAAIPTGNKIQGNYIGTNAAGTAAIPNGLIGVDVDGASQTLIGGFGAAMPGARNVISGNGGHGIRAIRGASLTRISGNYIGTQADGVSPLGNTEHGVSLQTGVTGTIIGGPEPDAGNTIAFNGKNGIAASADAGNNNLIDPNKIFGNALLGIDLGDDGNTPNDPGDADTGPNNLQNYPELVSAHVVNDELVINCKVDSAPGNSDYGTQGIYVEFFKADAGGEGEKFLGSAHYTATDYNSGSPQTRQVNLGNLSTLGVTNSDGFTAAASDAANNTSEFTPAVFITTPPVSSIAPGQLLISELRLSGETGADEYVELYNNTDSALDISGVRLDAVSGLSLTIPANEIVPARGHYLIAHQTGYTLSASAAPDQTYNFDLPTTTGLALFNTSGAVIDAVGFGTTLAPHKEGATLNAPTESAQYAFVRNMESGRPRDTDDNAADFILVSTDPSAITSVSGDRLGAPGPENLQSPIQRNATVKNKLLDPQAGSALPPNRVRDLTPITNGNLGTLSFRRRIRNMTGAPVTQLRFRIVDLTTLGSPGAGLADLRAVDSNDVDVTTSNGVVTVRGTLVGQPPAQLNGGGLNATLDVTLPGGALAPDATIDVQLLLGVQQGGMFRFFVNTEAGTSSAASPSRKKTVPLRRTEHRKRQ